jgi:hypothetical protein
VAVVEVTLTTMEARAWTAAAPEAELTLSEAEMIDLLRDTLIGEGCIPEGTWHEGSSSVTEMGPFAWLDIPPSDFGAGALFDARTGQMVFTLATDFLAWDERCTPPDPLDAAPPETSPAGEPSACHSAAGTCALEIDDLDTWGATSALVRGECWFDRSYDEVWDLVRHTSVAAAFDRCGDYEMFVRGMTTPGGSYATPLSANRMVFVLAGHADESVLP